jgi:hypothetical protein
MSSFSLSTAARVINQLEDAIQSLPLQNAIKLSVFLPDAGQNLQDGSDKLEDEIVQLEQYSEELGRTQTAAIRAALDCGVTALLVEKYALESTIARLSNLLSVDQDGRCEPNVMHSVMLSTQKRFEQGSSSDQTVRVSIVHEQLATRIRDRICAGEQRLNEIKTQIYQLGATTIVEIPDL